MKYIVSCDWLALSCEAPASFVLPDLDSVYEVGAVHFVCRPAVECNPYYAFSRCFYYRGEQAFHFFACPRHPDANPRDCSVKVANRLLYCSEWLDLLRLFLQAGGYKVNHLQRIDICGDFCEFSGGRKPAQFIRDYFSKPRNSHPSFIRRGSNKFRTYGEKKLGLLDFQTLSFGTRDSPVQVNLYNKSEELKTKDKPYIRDLWTSRGLDSDSVWRVEFSLNPQGMMLHHITADYITEVTFEEAAAYSKLSALFTTFAERYFKFYYVSKEDEIKRTKVAKLTPVVLFDYESEAEYSPISLCRKACTGEKERRAANLLAQELNYEALTPGQQEALRGALGYLNTKYATKAKATVTEEDVLLRRFTEDIASLPDVYSEKAKVTRVNRWLQALRHKNYDSRYNDFCKAFQYVDAQCEGFIESMRPVLETAAPDLLCL